MRFDLAAEPWIEGIDHDGRPLTLSLRQAFENASDVVSLTGPETVVAGITRLLVAILRDALPSTAISEDQWRQWWHNGLPAISDYFDTYADTFDLFGDRPFFQDATMDGDNTGIKSASELTPPVPSGNNPVLWDHHTDLTGSKPLTLTPGTAAGWLVSTQAFLRTGVFGSKDSAGNGRASGRQGLLLARAVCIPVGPTLAHTLLLSLPRGERPVGDVPPWRRDRAVIAGPPAGPVSLLTWQIRHILLLPEPDGTVKRLKIAADPAIDPRVDVGPQQAHDPHLAFTPNPKWNPDAPEIDPRNPTKLNRQFFTAPYRPDMATWRQAPALLGARSSARAVRDLATLPLDGVPVRVEVIGLAVESTAKYVAVGRSRLPGVLGEHAVQVLADLAEASDLAAQALARGGVALHKGLKLLPERPDPAATARTGQIFTAGFWPQLELPASDLMELLQAAPDDDAREALAEGWRERLKATARRTYIAQSSRYPIGTAAMQARSTGARYLGAGLKKIDPGAAEADDDDDDSEDAPADMETATA